jgi:ethanolamine ammonia-lyase large subunit
VPGADDVMLGYQSTSFHDAQYVRQLLGLRPAPEFEHWLSHMGVTDDLGRLRTANDVPALLAALEHAERDETR